MMKNWMGALVIGIATLGVTGCGKEGPNIAGTWVNDTSGSKVVLVAKSDGSFTASSSDGTKTDGTWQSSGDMVVMYQDVRNGGGAGFGSHWDGSYHYKLNSAQNQLVAEPIPGSSNNVSVVFVKKS